MPLFPAASALHPPSGRKKREPAACLCRRVSCGECAPPIWMPHRAGAALPYLTKGNVATESPENAETEGQIYGCKQFTFRWSKEGIQQADYGLWERTDRDSSLPFPTVPPHGNRQGAIRQNGNVRRSTGRADTTTDIRHPEKDERLCTL